MSKFTFYVEGINKEFEAVAETEKAAIKAIWDAMTDEQKNAVACFDCIDEVAV